MEKLTFHNTYFALRHGESLANVRGVIVSHLDEGKKEENTLTKNGEDQVFLSVMTAKKQGLLDGETITYSSPFSRCKRTAEIAKEVLGVRGEIIFDDRLRERWFGDWEGTSNENYKKVWEKDAVGGGHTHANVESTQDVVRRVIELVRDLEDVYSNKHLLGRFSWRRTSNTANFL